MMSPDSYLPLLPTVNGERAARILLWRQHDNPAALVASVVSSHDWASDAWTMQVARKEAVEDLWEAFAMRGLTGLLHDLLPPYCC